MDVIRRDLKNSTEVDCVHADRLSPESSTLDETMKDFQTSVAWGTELARHATSLRWMRWRSFLPGNAGPVRLQRVARFCTSNNSGRCPHDLGTLFRAGRRSGAPPLTNKPEAPPIRPAYTPMHILCGMQRVHGTFLSRNRAHTTRLLLSCQLRGVL